MEWGTHTAVAQPVNRRSCSIIVGDHRRHVRRRASLSDAARLRSLDEAIDVLGEQEPALRQRLGGGAYAIDIALVRRIALLDRRPRVAPPGALGGGSPAWGSLA